MMSLFQYPQMILSYALPMIILLGVLIFIHELGHFLVAKYFNVKVETFSLGFGPKLWQRQRGETTYCISAIPFGGYVKMFGDEIGKEISDPILRARSFLHKPIYQRILIALAGPLMNLFLAFILFWAISYLGETVVLPQLGDISAQSAAYKAGFRSGDKILSIDGTAMERWDEMDNFISERPGQTLDFKVQRENAEEPLSITATTTQGKSKNIFKLDHVIGEIEGFDYVSNSSLIAVSDPKGIFSQIGLKTGDQILTIDQYAVKTFRQIEDILLNESSQKKISISVDRYGLSPDAKPTRTTLDWDTQKIPFPDNKNKFGFTKPETFVGEVQKGSPAEIAGFKQNDQITSINGTPIKEFGDIIGAVSSYKENDPALSVSVLRDGEPLQFSVQPKMTEIKNEMGPSGSVEKRFAIGIKPLKSTYIESGLWRSSNPITGTIWAFKKTWQWTYNTVMSFVLLAKKKVSPKNLGGFISIGQMAQKSWEMGIDAFLRIMAIISLNLFVLNLLPVPVLDGGHILLFSIEAIKGSPLSLRKLEIAQQIGLFLLLSLMVFSLFNDVSRLWGAS